MTRRKRAPLSGDGARVEFARRIRELRDASGLSLRELADKSGYSQAALSTAESGRRVPSWELCQAFLQSCGQNPANWRQLWEVARDDTTPPESPAESNGSSALVPTHPAAGTTGFISGGPAETVSHWRTAARRGPRLAWFSAGLALGAALTYLVIPGASPARSVAASATTTRPVGSIQVRNGADPYASGCKPDRKQLDEVPMLTPEGRPFGTLILYYSPACQAEWGYATGPDSLSWTVHILVRQPNDGVTVPSSFTGTAPLPGSWGNLLSTRNGCVQAEAWVSDRSGSGQHAITACMQGG